MFGSGQTERVVNTREAWRLKVDSPCLSQTVEARLSIRGSQTILGSGYRTQTLFGELPRITGREDEVDSLC